LIIVSRNDSDVQECRPSGLTPTHISIAATRLCQLTALRDRPRNCFSSTNSWSKLQHLPPLSNFKSIKPGTQARLSALIGSRCKTLSISAQYLGKNLRLRKFCLAGEVWQLIVSVEMDLKSLGAGLMAGQ
jgi:hypothetical protein